MKEGVREGGGGGGGWAIHKWHTVNNEGLKREAFSWIEEELRKDLSHGGEN